jgi:hypothetical protein
MGADETGLARVAAAQHGAFTVAQARAAGFSSSGMDRRMIAGRWLRLAPGVLCLAGVPVTWELRLFAAVAGARSGTVASHRAAAQLYGIPGFTGNWVELTAPHGTHQRGNPARRHTSRRLPAHHVRRPAGIPATSVARTLADLAAVLHPGQTERAVDHCLARDLVTVESLWRVHQDLGPGRPGGRVLRDLLEARGGGYVAPASELERRFLQLVVAAGLPRPEREIDLGDGDGWIGRVEFVYRPAKLLVEVDGRRYHTALLDRAHDGRRDRRFVASGWRVLRIDYDLLVHHRDEVAPLVRRALEAAA